MSSSSSSIICDDVDTTLEKHFSILTEKWEQKHGKRINTAIRGLANNFHISVDVGGYPLPLWHYAEAVGYTPEYKKNAIRILKNKFKPDVNDKTRSEGNWIIRKVDGNGDLFVPGQKSSGQIRNMYYLTPKALKIFLINCGKPEADLIAEYFIDIEESARNLEKAIHNKEVLIIKHPDIEFIKNRKLSTRSTKEISKSIKVNVENPSGWMYGKLNGEMNKAASGMNKQGVREKVTEEFGFDPQNGKPSSFIARDFMTDVQLAIVNLGNVAFQRKIDEKIRNGMKVPEVEIEEDIDTIANIMSVSGDALNCKNEVYLSEKQTNKQNRRVKRILDKENKVKMIEDKKRERELFSRLNAGEKQNKKAAIGSDKSLFENYFN